MIELDALLSFIEKEHGKIVCISEDFSLVRSLRHSLAACTKAFEELIYYHQEAEAAFSVIESFYTQGLPLIVIVERVIAGKKSTDSIHRIRRFYPKAHVLVVGTNITKELTGYLFEIGVSAIVSKPLSAEKLFKQLSRCLQISKEQNLTAYIRELIASSFNDDALRVVNEFIEIHPENSIAYCLKGDVLIASGSLKEAITAYEEASRLNPVYTEPLKRMSAIFKYVDDKKALSLLHRIDRIVTFNPDRKLEMAELHLRLGEMIQAKSLLKDGFRQASQEFSFRLGDYAERITELVSEKMPELAEEYLAKAIGAKTSFSKLDLHMFNKLGMIYRNKGEWKEAIEVYKKAMEIAPTDPALSYNMALAYHSGEKQEEVIRCLNKAFSLNKDFYKGNEGVSYNLGSIYLEFGEGETAKPFFEHVLEMNPENDKAKAKLKTC